MPDRFQSSEESSPQDKGGSGETKRKSKETKGGGKKNKKKKEQVANDVNPVGGDDDDDDDQDDDLFDGLEGLDDLVDDDGPSKKRPATKGGRVTSQKKPATSTKKHADHPEAWGLFLFHPNVITMWLPAYNLLESLTLSTSTFHQQFPQFRQHRSRSST